MAKSYWAAGAIALSCIVAGTAVAGEPESPAEQSAKKASEDKSKKVCRTVVITGSRMSSRHCKTQAQWDKDTETARRYLEDGQEDGYRRDGEMNGQGVVGGAGPR